MRQITIARCFPNMLCKLGRKKAPFTEPQVSRLPLYGGFRATQHRRDFLNGHWPIPPAPKELEASSEYCRPSFGVFHALPRYQNEPLAEIIPQTVSPGIATG
jgi:hypothetical protein